MPCYQVNTVSLEFEPRNAEVLRRAVAGLGHKLVEVSPGVYHVDSPWGLALVTIQGGQAQGRAQDVNSLRQAYAQTALKVATEWAKAQAGAVVQRTSDNKVRLTLKGS